MVAQYESDPLFEGLVDEKVERWHQILLQRYREQRGIEDPVVVDNSKKVEWAKRIASNSNYDVRYVHLIRDPRALVLRWLNTYDTAKLERRQRVRVAKRMPARALHILTGDLATVYLYKWLRANRQISRYLGRSNRASTVVTYHDMVFDTERMLSRLMPELGLAFDPAQLRFGEGASFGTRKVAHADTVQRSEIRPDVRWRMELPSTAIELVETNADIIHYLSRTGLAFAENGLVAR